MAPWSRSDSLRLWLTGASSDGGAQSNPVASLGNFRSSTQVGGAAFLPADLAGVQLVFLSQANGAGVGTLSAVGPDSLTWAAPGDAAGSAIPIANGQTLLLESASSPNAYAIVTRTSSNPLIGAASIELLDFFNDGLGNADVPLPAPNKIYTCLCLKNGPTQTLKNVKIWIGTVTNPIRIALELPTAGHFQTIASPTTAPTGVTFVTPTSEGDPAVITVASMRPGDILGLWLERDASSASATPRAQSQILWSFTSIG